MLSSPLSKRGWDVAPIFVGPGRLDEQIFKEMQNHALIAGDSAWGVRNLLYTFIISARPKIVVEIGAHIGAAALAIGAALRANDFGKSYHIEPETERYGVLRDFISRAGLSEYAYALQMSSSHPALPMIVDREADLVFLDANHDYSDALQDLYLCDELLSQTGLIVIDDAAGPHSSAMCMQGRGGVRQAIADFVLSRPDFSAVFLDPPFWLNPCGAAMLARTSITTFGID